MSSKNFMSYEDAATVLGAYANTIKNKQDVLHYGGVNPSSGADGDMYVKLARDESTLFDMFGSPTAESTDDYEMSYTVDSSVMGDYYDYEAFGTGKGFGQNGRGSMTITYHFKNSKFKPANVSYCNNFSLSGGGYLESANFAIKASNDGTNWDTLYSTNTACPRDTSVSADITTNTYYSYFKFEMNSGGGYTGIKNIVMNGISESYSNIDNIYFKNDGTWLKDAFAKKSDLDEKQDTLTFDDVPTANSNNPVKSGGVYSALADKQDALTAGNYISIANDGTINVTQGIGVYDVYSYEIKSINSGYSTKITKRKNGVFVSEQDISNGTYSSENRLNVDNRFEFWYTFAGYLWHYKLLVDSNEHQKDEEVSWTYSTLVDYTETFNISQDSSTDLATKGDIEAAISSAYHHAGTKTCAELVAGLLVAGNEGNVYNMTDSGTTTADFIEGAGQPIKAGDNVGIAKISDGVYKFDLLSGFVDTSNFVQKSVTAGLLKNDGTVNDEIEGDVSSLKSGFTNLDNEVNGDATTYPYADVITIEDAVPANVADCSVKIEPDQNLHGYDKPWVGGAGKNKLPLVLADIKTANTDGTWNGNVYTINGGTFTVYTDDGGNITKIVANGTFSTRSTLRLRTSNDNYVLTQGSYIVSKGFTNSNVGIAIETFNGTTWVSRLTASTSTDNVSFTVDYDGYDRLYVYLEVTNTSSAVNETYYPMIRLATETDATFAPYTNICPISGHTEASVYRVGFNIWDGTATDGKGVGNNGTLYNDATLFATGYVRVFPNVTYYLNGTNWKNWVWVYNGDKNALQEVRVNTADRSIVFPSGTVYARFTGILDSKSTACINIFDSALNGTYVSYAGKTYTIALGDTIYGGTVNFDSGVMTVTHKYMKVTDLTRSNNTLFYKTLSDAGVPNNYTVLCDREKTANQWGDVGVFTDQYGAFMLKTAEEYTSAADCLTAYGGELNICYPLATPTTIQLTPQQIQLLQGQNTLTASTGQISVTANGVSGSIGAVQEQVNTLQKANVYATEPVKIGKWFDKDLYRVVVDMGALPDSAEKSVDSGLSSVKIKRIYGTALGTTLTMPLPYVDSNTIISLYYDAQYTNEIKVKSNVDASSLNGYAIIEYTES